MIDGTLSGIKGIGKESEKLLLRKFKSVKRIKEASEESISEVVGFLKGKSAIKMFDKHSELKRRYWGRHFWAKGYCVSTVGLDEEQIRKYVRWQLKRDKSMDQLELWKKK